jgi:hypothetical protein
VGILNVKSFLRQKKAGEEQPGWLLIQDLNSLLNGPFILFHWHQHGASEMTLCTLFNMRKLANSFKNVLFLFGS